ncbi:MAG: YceD family protein [Candidatus Thiodiazotropha sp.]
MSKRFPDRLDPWRFADLGREVSGNLPLEEFSRLRECLLETGGDVSFDLRFSRDEQRRARLDGTICAQLSLECQRCLGELVFPVESQLSVVFVQGLDEAERLSEALDPYMVEEGTVDLMELIEDELLLALPQVSMHDRDVCQLPADSGSDDPVPEPESGTQEKDNPFSVLAGLKRDEQ